MRIRLKVLWILALIQTAFGFEDGLRTGHIRWYFASPWNQETGRDSSGIQAHFNLPVSPQHPRMIPWDDLAEQSFRFAPVKPQTHMQPKLHLDALLPLNQDGQIRLGWSTPLSLMRESSWQDAHWEKKDTLNQHALFWDAWMNNSARIDLNWTEIHFSYRIAPTDFFSLELGLTHHEITLSGSGNHDGDLRLEVRWQDSLTDNEERFTSTWANEAFYSDWTGNYQGAGWNAHLKLTLGPFSWHGYMNSTFKLHGQYDLKQTQPFFLDPFSLKENLDWSDPLTRDSLQHQTAYSQSFHTTQPFQASIPQRHLFQLAPWPWLALQYTWSSDAFSIEALPEADSVDNAQTLDFRSLANQTLYPRHITELQLKTSWAHLSVGMFRLDHEWYPIVSSKWFLNFSSVTLNTQVDAYPWIRLEFGVHYAI